MIFLIDYDRGSGTLMTCQPFHDNQNHLAEEMRLGLEIANLTNKLSHEIVLLEASTEDDLRRTHRRYFESVEELQSSAAALQQQQQQHDR